MNIAHQRPLGVREIGDIGVAGVEARGCRVGISGVAGEYHAVREAQEPDMTPVAGVKLLAVHDERLRLGGRVELHTVIGDIRKALLLVDDERLDDIQALGTCLRNQMGWHIPIGTAVIHVHMHIAAHPVSRRRHRPESIRH